MSEIRRVDQEIADLLGLVQRLRVDVTAVTQADAPAKLGRRLAKADAELASLQERLNLAVVADPEKRARLMSRSRGLRDAEEGTGREGDLLDALQALSADAAHAVASWRVVKPLAKAAKDAEARALVKMGLPAAEDLLSLGLEACAKQAKREADALDA